MLYCSAADTCRLFVNDEFENIGKCRMDDTNKLIITNPQLPLTKARKIFLNRHVLFWYFCGFIINNLYNHDKEISLFDDYTEEIALLFNSAILHDFPK